MYDVNQSIYLFRNKVITVPVLSDTTFSQTFRFGKNIAYFANWVISIIQYIRDGKQIREPVETDSTFIKHNDEIKDEVVSYSDDWTDKVLQHEDKTPMVILRQNSHLTYIALNLLYETRQSTVRYKFDLPNKEARQSMTTSMNIFVTAMKISFEEYSLNQRTPTVMKDLSTIEDLRKFVIEKEGERELTLTCTAIRTAITLKDEGNVTYDDYVTIINRARQLFSKELNVRVSFRVGTTHFMKGLEAKNVILAPGFIHFFSDDGFNKNLNQEEAFILFTAITRAQETLFMPKDLIEQFQTLSDSYSDIKDDVSTTESITNLSTDTTERLTDNTHAAVISQDVLEESQELIPSNQNNDDEETQMESPSKKPKTGLLKRSRRNK